jgi:hypothetical protein
MGLHLLTLVDELSTGSAGDADLANSCLELQACTSVGDLWSAARRWPGSVAVVGGQRISGPLSEEHRHYLALIVRAVPLILVIEARFGQHPSVDDVGVTAGIDTPIEKRTLLDLVAAAQTKVRQISALAATT